MIFITIELSMTNIVGKTKKQLREIDPPKSSIKTIKNSSIRIIQNTVEESKKEITQMITLLPIQIFTQITQEKATEEVQKEENGIKEKNDKLTKNAILIRKSIDLENLRKNSRISDIKKDLLHNLIDKKYINSNDKEMDKDKSKDDNSKNEKSKKANFLHRLLQKKKQQAQAQNKRKSVNSEDLLSQIINKGNNTQLPNIDNEKNDRRRKSSSNYPVLHKKSPISPKIIPVYKGLVEKPSANKEISEAQVKVSVYKDLKVEINKTETIESFKPKKKLKLLCCFQNP